MTKLGYACQCPSPRTKVTKLGKTKLEKGDLARTKAWLGLSMSITYD